MSADASDPASKLAPRAADLRDIATRRLQRPLLHQLQANILEGCSLASTSNLTEHADRLRELRDAVPPVSPHVTSSDDAATLIAGRAVLVVATAIADGSIDELPVDEFLDLIDVATRHARADDSGL